MGAYNVSGRYFSFQKAVEYSKTGCGRDLSPSCERMCSVR